MGDSGETSSATDFKSLARIPRLPFDGKNEAWTPWKLRFTAWMKLIDVYDVMVGRTAPPSEPSARASFDTKNSTAYTFIITNVSDAAFNVVSQAPEDQGNKAWQLLLNRYETKTRAQKIQLLSELMRIKLTPSQDPEELFTKVNEVVKQLSYWENLRNIDDDWLIGIAINALPEAYAELTTVLDSADNLTYEETKDKIRAFYSRRITTAPPPDDAALLATGNPVCFNCKRKGHKANACPLRSKPSGDKWCEYHKSTSHSDLECQAQGRTPGTKPRPNVGF